MAEHAIAFSIYNIVLGIEATIGLLYATMPWLMPPYDCFSITIPIEMGKHREILHLKTQYSSLIAAFTIALICCGTLCQRIASGYVAVFGIIGLMSQVVTTLLIFQVFRNKTRRLKRREGWDTLSTNTTVSIFDPSLPKSISFLFELITVPIAVLSLILSITLYPNMPSYIPVQVSLSGIPTSFLRKTPFIVAIPSILQLFSTSIFMLSHYLAIHSKRKIRPELPLESARAYHLFLKMKCICNLISNITLSTVLLLLPLMFSRSISFYQMLMAIIFSAIIVGFINSFINIYYGQTGSNFFTSSKGPNETLFDDDSKWLGGLLYYNPTDSSTIVPKRFGYGWTFNFASPWTWVCLALLIALFFLLKMASDILVQT